MTCNVTEIEPVLTFHHIVPIILHKNNPRAMVKIYAMPDNCSGGSLVSTDILE